MTRIEHLALVALLAAGMWLTACGKEGPPVPVSHSLFQFSETKAELVNGCLAIDASLEGSHENAAMFELELESLTGDLCTGCPFTPSRRVELRASSARDGRYAFLYCPESRGDAYRWRLVAHNLFPSLPHALSPVVLTFPPE
jgi:hypothetical protein